MRDETSTITASFATPKSVKLAGRQGGAPTLEIATEQCYNWLSTCGISATTTRKMSIGPYVSADLCKTSSAKGAKGKSGPLQIRLVSEGCTKTSRRGCKGCLKVLVLAVVSQQQLSDLWQRLTCLTSSSLRGWNLSLALLMPKPVGE